MRRLPEAPVYHLVAQLERGTLQHWRKDKHNGHSFEASLERFLVSVETTLQRSQGDKLAVTVCVIDKEASKSLVGYFSLQKTENGRAKVAEVVLSAS